jgi:predicted SAM-dependent methyltransferase
MLPQKKLPYLNLGCSIKIHPEWVNIDMVSNHPDVEAHNLLKGIPRESNTFEVVYHCQVVEHIPYEDALSFMQECFRVLKPNGIIRVVTPDLEGIVREYLRLLEKNLQGPDEFHDECYDWMMIEMYDQVVRRKPGGRLSDFLRRDHIPNEDYVLSRLGKVGYDIRNYYFNEKNRKKRVSWKKVIRNLPITLWTRIRDGFQSSSTKLGKFRSGGEIHEWMYDRFSLGRLMQEAGFVQPAVVSPHASEIPDWPRFELDVKKGNVLDPSSLFMEARKP